MIMGAAQIWGTESAAGWLCDPGVLGSHWEERFEVGEDDDTWGVDSIPGTD